MLVSYKAQFSMLCNFLVRIVKIVLNIAVSGSSWLYRLKLCLFLYHNLKVMKKNLIIIATLFLGSLYINTAKAQQSTALAADQNPRHRESEHKYARRADTLNNLHGTTIQNTYKAYDWYEARQERRQQNRAWRHEEYLNSGYSGYSPSWGLYGSSYAYPYSWGSYGYGSRFGGRGRVGFGIGW